MLIKRIAIKDIVYQEKEYPIDLLESIIERGILLYPKIQCVDNQFICIDGHKRITAIVSEKLPITEIMAVIENDFSKQGSTYWGFKNQH